MKFNSLFIANLAETARPFLRYSSQTEREREIFEDQALCDRFLFSEEDNRGLVTPCPIDKDFFNDTGRLLGFKNIINLSPAKSEASLSGAILEDKRLLSLLISLIKKNPGIKIHSYAATREFQKLIHFLKSQNLSFSASELPPDGKFWTADFFDSKAGFRQLICKLEARFPPPPEGVIVDNFDDLIGWAEYFLRKADGAVIKANCGLAGAGLEIIKKEEVKDKNIYRYVADLIKDRPYWSDAPVVVEEFINPAGSAGGFADLTRQKEPNVEGRVLNGKVEILYTCGMRIDKKGVFKGVEIGKGALSPKLEKKLIAAGEILGEAYKKYGYRGYFDIDFILGKSGRLYSLESNVRRTGGTHVFELAQRLLGADFFKNYYLVSNNICPTKKFKGKSYRELKKAVKHLLFPINGKKEGVILTIINYLVRGNLGYVVISDRKEKAIALENEFLKLL